MRTGDEPQEMEIRDIYGEKAFFSRACLVAPTESPLDTGGGRGWGQHRLENGGREGGRVKAVRRTQIRRVRGAGETDNQRG